MSHRNEVKLLLYDYKLVGATMGTHSSVQINDIEYWYSITGLKKRNRRTGATYLLDESRVEWKLKDPEASSNHQLTDQWRNFTNSFKNLGSISSHSATPRETIECGYTTMSEGGLEANIKSFINVEFSSYNYNLESMNCNTFSRFMIQYLSPTRKEWALDALSAIIYQTAETVNNVEQGIRNAKNQAVDFVANNGPLVVMGAAAATSFVLRRIFG